MGSPSLRNGLVYLILLAALGAFLLTSISRNNQAESERELYDLNQLVTEINSGNVSAVTVARL